VIFGEIFSVFGKLSLEFNLRSLKILLKAIKLVCVLKPKKSQNELETITPKIIFANESTKDVTFTKIRNIATVR